MSLVISLIIETIVNVSGSSGSCDRSDRSGSNGGGGGIKPGSQLNLVHL